MDWIGDYVDLWTREGGSVGAIVVLALSAVLGVMVAAVVLVWVVAGIVGVARFFAREFMTGFRTALYGDHGSPRERRVLLIRLAGYLRALRATDPRRPTGQSEGGAF